MDVKEEYHDPDYPEASIGVKEEPPSVSEEDKIETIKDITRREFSTELEMRESEIMLIDQRMTTSRRLLHHLRYALVNNYYKDQKLHLTSSQIQDDIASQTEPRVRAEVSSLLRDGQRRLHPSVRKLLGRQSVDIDEIFRSRAPRNKSRKDYSAMLQKRNYTISADTTRSLRPCAPPGRAEAEPRPRKVPRHIEPRLQNVLTLDEATRNKMKHRYRFIIGNTSKYAPAASRADRSSHQWLLYVRGARGAAAPGAPLRAVTAHLHHSYAPHHTVHVSKPPYHISRRGWGEFPAKVELHFALPDRNRPATIEHTIKLDRNYTGMQMLGAETIVDVWLYSTPEMLEFEYKEEDDQPQSLQTEPQPIKEEPLDINTEGVDPLFPLKEEPDESLTTNFENCDNHDNWLDFFSKPSEMDVDEMIIKPEKRPDDKKDLESLIDTNVIDKCQEPNIGIEEVEKIDTDLPNELLNQTSVKKRIVKYIDPTTGKIYYLEMDRALDLTKVQEIIINNSTKTKISPIKSNGLKNVRKKKGVSLLKPEVKSQLKSESFKSKHDYSHIENDHCYLATPPKVNSQVLPVVNKCEVRKERTLYDVLCSTVCRFDCVRSAVNYIIKKIPLVSEQARDPEFVKNFPFVVENEEKYWKLDFAKRRNIEWSRAKLINRILTENFTQTETIWRTKQILLYSRLHGFYPIRTEIINRQSESDWTSWNIDNIESLGSNVYPNINELSSLSVFDISQTDSLSECVDLTEDEDIDVVNDRTVVVKRELAPELDGLTVIPVESDQDRMMYLYIERKCADIGIELKNEDVGNGCSYSAVHAVMLSAMRSFAEELIRSALAAKLTLDQRTEQLPTVWAGSSSSPACVSGRHVWSACSSPRLQLCARAGLAARRAAPPRPRL